MAEAVEEKAGAAVEAADEAVADVTEAVEEKTATTDETVKEAVAEVTEVVEVKAEAPAPAESVDAAE